MVQVGASVDQDNEGESTEQEQSWTHLINDAVKDFVQAIRDSSSQLATAAERFAGDSLSMIDEATSKAESSAAASSQMAEAAKQAAAEAQSAAESLQVAVAEAGAKFREEALTQATETQQISEGVRSELRQEAAELIQRVERSTENSQEVVRAAQQTTDDRY